MVLNPGLPDCVYPVAAGAGDLHLGLGVPVQQVVRHQLPPVGSGGLQLPGLSSAPPQHRAQTATTRPSKLRAAEAALVLEGAERLGVPAQSYPYRSAR
eukprot:2814827-Pyramimonas_sp.AAC.1